eukprot:9846221-Ditylum_brightwellii.AAC.1
MAGLRGEKNDEVDVGVMLANEGGRTQVPGEEWGDVSIHGFWERGTTSIFDVRITNLYAATHQLQDPKRLIAKAEWEKRK